LLHRIDGYAIFAQLEMALRRLDLTGCTRAADSVADADAQPP
jgi:hypothetical protein